MNGTGLNSAEKVKAIADLSKTATWIIYPNGGIWWSAELYDLYQMKRGEGITTQDFKTRVFSEDWPRFESILNQATKEKESFSFEVRIHIGASFVWVHIKGEVKKDGTIIGITQNIDEFYRGYAELLQDMKVIKALSLNPKNSVSKIHRLLHG